MKTVCQYFLPILLVGLVYQFCGFPTHHLSNRAFLRLLSGLEYRIDDQLIQLEKGKSVQKIAPDAAEMSVALSDWLVLGDLNGDRQDDAAIVLITDKGGTGEHYYLVPVLRQDKQPVALNAICIGERISIVSLNIEDQQIDVVYLDREPGDSVTALPKIEIRRRFSVKGDRLTELPLSQDFYVKR